MPSAMTISIAVKARAPRSRRAQTLPAEGQPEDVANAVLFYASARSGFVTGDFMDVNGGMYQLW